MIIESELIKIECYIGETKIENLGNPFKSNNKCFKSYDANYSNYWKPQVKKIQQQLETEGKQTKIVETTNGTTYRVYLLLDYQTIENEGTDAERVVEDDERETKEEAEELKNARQQQLDKNKQYVKDKIVSMKSETDQLNDYMFILRNSTIEFTNDESKQKWDELKKFDNEKLALINKKDELKEKINNAKTIDEIASFDLETLEGINEGVEGVEGL